MALGVVECCGYDERGSTLESAWASRSVRLSVRPGSRPLCRAEDQRGKDSCEARKSLQKFGETDLDGLV